MWYGQTWRLLNAPILTLEPRTPESSRATDPPPPHLSLSLSPAPPRHYVHKRPFQFVSLFSAGPLCTTAVLLFLPRCPSSNNPAGILVHRDTVEDNPVAVRTTVGPHLFYSESIDLGDYGRCRELPFDVRGPLAAGDERVTPFVQVDAMKDVSRCGVGRKRPHGASVKAAQFDYQEIDVAARVCICAVSCCKQVP